MRVCCAWVSTWVSMWVISAWVLCMYSVMATTAAQGPTPQNAFVLLHYEGTAADDAYLLGTRVAIASVFSAHPPDAALEFDVVVLCVEGVRASSRAAFEADGARTVMVPRIENPFANVKDRFRDSLAKLHAFNLVEYERVVFLDSDSLVLRDSRALFECGAFCAVFLNPTRFHTALMVIKPDAKIFGAMTDALALPRDHPDAPQAHDGADQGFLNDWFGSAVRGGPLFDVYHPADGPRSRYEDPAMRLTIAHAMHHIYFYEHGSWDGYRVSGPGKRRVAVMGDPPALTMSFPGPVWTKPWDWRGYLFFVGNWRWADVRSTVGGGYWDDAVVASLAKSLCLAVALPAMLTAALGLLLSPWSGLISFFGLCTWVYAAVACTAVLGLTYGLTVVAELVSPFVHPWAGLATVGAAELVGQELVRRVGVWVLRGQVVTRVDGVSMGLAATARVVLVVVGSLTFHFVLKVLLLGASILASLGLVMWSWWAVDPVSEDPVSEDPVSEDPVSKDPESEGVGDWRMCALGVAAAYTGAAMNVTGMIVAEQAVDMSAPPLFDLGHEYLPMVDPIWGEVLLGAPVAVMLVIGVGYFRFASGWNILGRVFATLGAIYVVRGVAIGVTAIPVPPNHCRVDWEAPEGPLGMVWLRTLATVGLGRHCGDLILSGHTIVVALSGLVMASYYAHRMWWGVSWAVWALCASGCVSFVATRNHYVVDVWLALIVTVSVWLILPRAWSEARAPSSPIEPHRSPSEAPAKRGERGEGSDL